MNFTVPFQATIQPDDVQHSAAVQPVPSQHKIFKLSELLAN